MAPEAVAPEAVAPEVVDPEVVETVAEVPEVPVEVLEDVAL